MNRLFSFSLALALSLLVGCATSTRDEEVARRERAANDVLMPHGPAPQEPTSMVQELKVGASETLGRQSPASSPSRMAYAMIRSPRSPSTLIPAAMPMFVACSTRDSYRQPMPYVPRS